MSENVNEGVLRVCVEPTRSWEGDRRPVLCCYMGGTEWVFVQDGQLLTGEVQNVITWTQQGGYKQVVHDALVVRLTVGFRCWRVVWIRNGPVGVTQAEMRETNGMPEFMHEHTGFHLPG